MSSNLQKTAHIQEKFLSSCIERLRGDFEVLSASSTIEKDITKRCEYVAIDRIITVIREYVAHCKSWEEPEYPDDFDNSLLKYVSVTSLHVSFLRQLGDWLSKRGSGLGTEVDMLIQSRILKPSLEEMLHPQQTLARDFEKLFLSNASSDIVFVVGEEEIPAHKLILTTRIPYFEHLFASGIPSGSIPA